MFFNVEPINALDMNNGFMKLVQMMHYSIDQWFKLREGGRLEPETSPIQEQCLTTDTRTSISNWVKSVFVF